MIFDWETKLTWTTNLQRIIYLFRKGNAIVNATIQGAISKLNYLLSNCRWILSSNRNIRVSHIWYRPCYMLKLILKLDEVFFQSNQTFLKILTWRGNKNSLLSSTKNTDWQTNRLPSSTSLSRSKGSSFPFIFLATLFLSSRIPSTSCYLQAFH